MKNTKNFYSDCVEDFHKTANTKNVASKGLIFIPELIEPGQKTILAYLKDPFFQMQTGNNPTMYYYLIMSLSIDAGICFAMKWHENYGALNQYVEEIIEEGSADDANKLLTKYFPSSISANQGNEFFQVIFQRWLEMHEPYWKLKDPRQYTFEAMLAAYQLGISMMLDKLGY